MTDSSQTTKTENQNPPTVINPTQAADTSPLREVKIDSIERLFNTAADELTDADIETIVDKFAEDRKRFLESPDAKPKAEKKKAADLNLKLEDLGL